MSIAAHLRGHQRACWMEGWMDGWAGLASWLEGDHRHGFRDEEELEGSVDKSGRRLESCCLGTQKRPLCCWTTMRTLSHVPEDCGKNLVIYVSKFSVMFADIVFVLLHVINYVKN